MEMSYRGRGVHVWTVYAATIAVGMMHDLAVLGIFFPSFWFRFRACSNKLADRVHEQTQMGTIRPVYLDDTVAA